MFKKKEVNIDEKTLKKLKSILNRMNKSQKKILYGYTQTQK